MRVKWKLLREYFFQEKMADCDELQALRKVKTYIKNLESKVRELELMATIREQTVNRHGQTIKNLEQRDEALGKTIKIREQTIEDLRGYNKIWRNNWCERVMKRECPLFMEFYSGRMSSETFKKHFQTI